ncbi:MAG: transposase [Byssovorax sp.]
MTSIGWLITFCCHGNWLPGDRRGYVEHAAGGKTFRAPPNARLNIWAARQMSRRPFLLDAHARAVVHTAIRDQCLHAGWILHALHVRTNHLHVVLSGTDPPARMMNQIKAWATRRLRAEALIGADTKPWARHGSTVPLRTQESLTSACHYVIEGQGQPLE